MFRTSNNKVNPSLKEKQQKKDKQEKRTNRETLLRAQEEGKRKRAEEFALLNSRFKPGNLYRLGKQTLSRFALNTIVLLINIRQDRRGYCFEVVIGEDIEQLYFTFERAMSCLKEIDINSELE